MRVPPEVLHDSAKWQFPLVTVLLSLTVIVGGLVSGFDPSALATQSNRISKLEVVVAGKDFEVGQTIREEDLSYAVLPVQSVPPETLRSAHDLIGRTVGTHVPVGMPMGNWLLASKESDVPESELEMK